jgi:beta-galactosidase
MLGVCYYPEHWPESWWEDDARRMREVGISFVRIAEFAWSRIEPAPGRFDLDWLDRAVDLLHRHGLKVVMCTPTATPPKWLMDLHPDIAPMDAEGRVRGFGSRRHYTFSSEVYFDESRRIVEIIAKRYGAHPGVVGWQTDNEYGCHDTVLSYSPVDRTAFQAWLRRRYQSPDRLDEAWGNVFWSMETPSFDAVALPVGAVTETSPAARLEYRRFASEQVVAYDRMQVEIIRKHSPGRFVTHNFMGFFTEFDHWPFGEHLDLASWDSYPIGFAERFPFSEPEHARWAETSHPDIAPFHHDLYRGVGRGRWWVMEQQPGPVNWAPWNPVPKPGQIRLFTWEALAHGAEVVSYFRWRQAPFGQEQMHAGLNRPDRTLSPGGEEASTVGRELATIGALPASGKAPVALVFDYEACWILEIQPQGKDFDYRELVFRWYEAIRRFGLDVDIVPPGADLAAYRAVVVPTLPYASEAAVAAFEASNAPILFGPRTGSKTRHYAIPEGLPPGPLASLIPVRVTQVSSLRPGLTKPVEGAVAGLAMRWIDHVEIKDAKARVLSEVVDPAYRIPAVIAGPRGWYVTTWPDADLLTGTMRGFLEAAGLELMDLPEAIRIRRRGALTFAFNYGPQTYRVPAPEDAVFLLGARELPAQGVACWR